jgi:hypothetical protein
MKHLKHASETLAKTPEKHLKPLQKHTQYPDKTLANMCETYTTCKLTHDKNTCNIHVKKQMKHCEQKLATYVYNHCNICDISLYFCNTHKKHLQHTSKTLEAEACNMCFQVQHKLAVWAKIEARQRGARR